MQQLGALGLVLLFFLWSLPTCSQENLIACDGWQLVGNAGGRLNDPHDGPCLAVTGSPQGSVFWRKDYEFLPGALYQVTCEVKLAPGAAADAVLIGSSFANRDLHANSEWSTESVLFAAPDDPRGHFVRLGAWQAHGDVLFRNLTVTPLLAIHRRQAGVELGLGESLTDQGYTAFYQYGGPFSNCGRCLDRFDAHFNTNRWDITEGRQVIMRHEVGGFAQSSGSLELNVSYRRDGFLEIAVSRDGRDWQEVAALSALGRSSIALPKALFPTRQVFVRIRGCEPKTRMQFNEYRYRAALSGNYPRFSGGSNYLKTVKSAPNISLQWLESAEAVDLNLTLSDSEAPQEFEVVLQSETGEVHRKVSLRPGASKQLRVSRELAAALRDVKIVAEGRPEPIYQVRGSYTVPILDAEDFGFLIGRKHDAILWWCDGVRKIGRHRRPPNAPIRTEIEIRMARHEYEPVQLVVCPQRDVRAMSVSVGPLKHMNGRTLPKEATELYQVAYVPIQVPSDYIGAVGDWPDPLPPLQPLSLSAGQNQPVWILVYVPPQYPAGDYVGEIIVDLDGKKAVVPLRVRVWDFTLPKETHLQTAFGFYPSLLQRYHRLSDKDRLNELLDAYYLDFARHRISPYDPFVLAPIKARFDARSLTAELDFTEFDRAYQKYIGDWGFNTFRLNVQGLPSGNFHSRRKGELAGFASDSREYRKLLTDYLGQLQNRLESLGALDQAYLYWFDEPEPKDYPFVREIMMMIHDAAPKLTRMLTEQPEPELYGAVDLWCPISHRFQPQIAEERRKAGERFWWYICTSPKAPYPGLFIDHPAVELRTWIWQTRKYGIDGILIWSANYWTSADAFPWPTLQNPYQDPMSYRSGGAVAAGERAYWGNGDGRLIYPPQQVFTGTEKCCQGPVSSIRWEMLRDGIEDYEYFWLLDDGVKKLRNRGGDRKLLDRAQRLLIIPDEVTRSMTEFSTSPQPIFDHRLKLAEMIVELQAALQKR